MSSLSTVFNSKDQLILSNRSFKCLLLSCRKKTKEITQEVQQVIVPSYSRSPLSNNDISLTTPDGTKVFIPLNTAPAQEKITVQKNVICQNKYVLTLADVSEGVVEKEEYRDVIIHPQCLSAISKKKKNSVINILLFSLLKYKGKKLLYIYSLE